MITVAPGATFTCRVEGFPSGLTGTVGVQVIDHTGAVVTARATAGITESPASSGSYIVTLTAPATLGQYSMMWDQGTIGPSTTAAEDLVVTAGTPDALNAAVVAIEAKTNLIGAGTVTYAGPVTAGGAISIVQGDDYKAADGRALQWTSTGWPNLTAASVEFSAIPVTAHGAEFSKAGTVVSPTGTAEVQVELAAADTGSLAAGQWLFNVVATLSDGSKATLVKSQMLVAANPG